MKLLTLCLLPALTNLVMAVEDLGPTLEASRQESNAPAVGAIVLVDAKVAAIGVAGVRKAGDDTKATTQDKWHIGSCTKSMTATLAATFVEEGAIGWNTTLKDALGKSLRMHEDYEKVTLRDLLAHRSGLPASIPPEIKAGIWQADRRGNIRTRRARFAKEILRLPPSSVPGTNYSYSNAGYIIAGYMLEELGGRSWEELMEERLFKPLGMNTAGFGSPSSRRRVDQPWPHDDANTPHPQGPGDDNPEVYGPAGTVHASLEDLAKYLQMHLLRTTGPVLKKAGTYDELHRNVGNNKDHALGWAIPERGWAKGATLSHSGTNTMNYCAIWAAPQTKFGVIAVTNFGGEDARRTCDSIATKMILQFANQQE